MHSKRDSATSCASTRDRQPATQSGSHPVSIRIRFCCGERLKKLPESLRAAVHRNPFRRRTNRPAELQERSSRNDSAVSHSERSVRHTRPRASRHTVRCCQAGSEFHEPAPSPFHPLRRAAPAESAAPVPSPGLPTKSLRGPEARHMTFSKACDAFSKLSTRFFSRLVSGACVRCAASLITPRHSAATVPLGRICRKSLICRVRETR